MKFFPRQAVVLTATVLLVFICLAVVFREFVRVNLVIPIYYLGWVIGQILASIPQSVIAFTLGIVGIILAFIGLEKFQNRVIAVRKGRLTLQETTRYQFWLRRFQRLDTNSFYTENLATELRRFLLGLLSDQESLPTWEIEQQIMNGTFEVPPDVRLLVQNRGFGGQRSQDNPFKRWVQEWIGRIWPDKRPAQPASPNQAKVETIIHYIEDRLMQA